MVAHSHADAVIALTNTPTSDDVLANVYGHSIAVAPYIRPGFTLSKLVGTLVRERPDIKGVVLSNHGLFTWGNKAKEAYDNHIDLVTQAEEYAQRQAAGKRAFGAITTPALKPENRHHVAASIAPVLRGAVSRHQSTILRYDDSPDVLELASSQLGRDVSSIGPATPDHIIQTKRLPLWLENQEPDDLRGLLTRIPEAVENYADAYRHWHAQHTEAADLPIPGPLPSCGAHSRHWNVVHRPGRPRSLGNRRHLPPLHRCHACSTRHQPLLLPLLPRCLRSRILALGTLQAQPNAPWRRVGRPSGPGHRRRRRHRSRHRPSA